MVSPRVSLVGPDCGWEVLLQFVTRVSLVGPDWAVLESVAQGRR